MLIHSICHLTNSVNYRIYKLLITWEYDFFTFTGSPVSGSLVTHPKDVVVALGQIVQLNCSTDDKYSVNWWHVPVGSTTNEDVFISNVVVMPYHPRFQIQRNEVENSIHHYNLVISSMRREDAGKYTCIDRAGHGEQRDAQLVVLGENSSLDKFK